VILSDNDLEHLSLALACQWVGVPFVPISPAYSLVSRDFAKLRHIAGIATPGLVFASGAAYGPAIDAVFGADVEVVFTDPGSGLPSGRRVTTFAELQATLPAGAEEAAHARVDGDTVVKLLFTSGSTSQPKGVINTQRMWCANLQMATQAFAFMADEPPVLLDWLPWNHTFGGNQNVGLTVYNGGTLYIDEGKPTAAGIATTLRNLREISPTIYFNVPTGFEQIALAMDSDPLLRDQLFARLNAFMFAGAGLSQAVWDKLDRHAVAATGMRVRMLTGLGMTETAPSCTFALGDGVRSGHIGLPCPGVEVKLVPMNTTGEPTPFAKTEIRFRGPNVMPGYWRAPEQSAAAFDDEGFYCTGDAVRFVDPGEPSKGLLFDGRVAEDFKLATGAFVSVGPLRAKVVLAGAPLVQDAVVTGLNRSDIGLMIFPQAEACRRAAGLSAGEPIDAVLAHPVVVAHFQALVDRLFAEGTGSATRVARAVVLHEPPSIDRGEVTDKGSINQRAVLAHRAALVEALHEGGAPRALMPNTTMRSETT
jgi:feruloyl-CoA synthase